MSVVVFGIVMSTWSVGLYYIDISMGYLYAMMGIIISSAVIPGSLTLLWKRQSKLAVCLSPPIGFVCAMTAWLLMSKVYFGSITIETTGSDLAMLVGNLVALLSPVILVPAFTLIKPDAVPYDFVSMRAIEPVDDGLGNTHQPTIEETERGISVLKGNSKSARIIAMVLTACLTVIWPWPLYGTSYVFSKPFFTAWVILGIVWMFFSFVIVGLYPIIENYKTISSVCKLMHIDLRRRLRRNIEDNVVHATDDVKMNSLVVGNGEI
jgi:hypothetical protein